MSEDTLPTWGHLETVTESMTGALEPFELIQPGLTLLCHPEHDRIGERAVFGFATPGKTAQLSRLEPQFSHVGGGRRHPLMDPRLSRKPLELEFPQGGGVVIRDVRGKLRIAVQGEPLVGERRFSAEQLAAGVVILMAERVTLLLHPMEVLPQAVPAFGLIGESAGIRQVRRQIERVADLEVPCLIRGESGTGKELVASAIHLGSSRRQRVFEAVNMGALPVSLAAAELFGAAKGAYTGADRKKEGLFSRADTGTLFLDEIGETPPEVQVLLLRALETGRIRPVGAEAERAVDVRLLAATDADLELAIDEGRFRAPLLHRLSGYELRLPPLRDRLDDLGRLLIHFLKQELSAVGEADRFELRGRRPWLPASLVAQLALYDWPGNVRQLRNVARQLVIGSRGKARLQLTAQLRALFGLSSGSGASPPLTPSSSGPGSADPSSGAVTPIPPAPRSPPAQMPPPAPVPGTDPMDRPLSPPAGAPPADNDGMPMVSTQEVSLIALVAQAFVSADGSVPEPVMRALIQPGSAAALDRHGGLPVTEIESQEKRAGTPEGEESSSEAGLYTFARPSAAVAFALAFHREGRRVALQTEHSVESRVAVWLAEGSHLSAGGGAAGFKVKGTDASHAKALAALALPGQTLLTRGAFDLARTQPIDEAETELDWLEHGTYRLTLPGADGGGAVEICEVGLRGVAPLTPPRAQPDDGAIGQVASQPARAYRSPDAVGEEELLETLRAHAFRLQPTAAALGISRTSLYALIDRSDRIRKAKDLTRQHIEHAAAEHDGDLDAMAAALEVSRKGLRRRMTRLGFD